MSDELVTATRRILEAIDFPFEALKAKWQERAPKLVLALARIKPEGCLADAKPWGTPGQTVLGSRQLIAILNADWGEAIGMGSYDEVRRSCVKFLVEAGVALKDPDNPQKSPNAPNTGYAISPEFGRLLAAWDTNDWGYEYGEFTSNLVSLREKFRQERAMSLVPVTLPDGTRLELSPGSHNELQASIIDHFIPRYAHGAEVVYIADALARQLYKNDDLMQELGVFDLDHRQLPDVIAYKRDQNWLYIIEAVANSGHVSPLRLIELKRLLESCSAPPVFVTAFPNYEVYSKFADDMAWETEVWIASHPTHLIHYDGKRFLGPYE